MAVFLLVPAGDAAESLRELLARAVVLGRPDIRVVVLDDGMNDDNAAVVAAFPAVTLLRPGRKHGLGLAYRTLLRYALAHAEPGDLVVTVTPGEAKDAGWIPSLIAAAERGADLVIASRSGAGEVSRGSWRRRVTGRLGRALVGWLFPVLKRCELAGGFRLYRVELLARMARVRPGLVTGSDVRADVELLLTACSLNPRIAEVPLAGRPPARRGGGETGGLGSALGFLGLLYDARVRTMRRARGLSGQPVVDGHHPKPRTPTIAGAGTGPRAGSG